VIIYNQMPIWANIKARRDLLDFRNLVVEYFNNISTHSVLGGEIAEHEAAVLARRKINLMSNRVTRWAAATGYDSEVGYREAPMIGGRAYSLHLISNVFHLADLEVDYKILIDMLEKALGVYEDDVAYSIIRTFNPFFWLGRLFNLISSLPFMLLGRLGFNQDKAESSSLGKIIKGTLYFIQVFAAFLAIFEKLGFLDRIKSLFAF